MIISKKKYKKLNDDLVDAKAKVDDAKKALDDENKIMRVSLLIKQERDKFEQMLNKECECGFQMEGKYHDMKKESDTLIGDLSWYKAKVSRLEREKEQLKESHIKHITNMENYYKDRVQKLKEEKEEFHRKLMTQLEVNTTLRMSNRYKLNLLSEISQHIGNKPSSSTYKYFRAKLDSLGFKEGE